MLYKALHNLQNGDKFFEEGKLYAEEHLQALKMEVEQIEQHFVKVLEVTAESQNIAPSKPETVVQPAPTVQPAPQTDAEKAAADAATAQAEADKAAADKAAADLAASNAGNGTGSANNGQA